MSFLYTDKLTMRFGGLTAVNNLNLNVDKNQIVSVIGPNGAGKTTVFNMISGIYKPSEGEIYFKGKCINGLRPDEIAKCGISRTFQTIRLYKNLTVLENVMIAHHLRIKSGLFPAVLRFPSAVREEKKMLEESLALLEESGLVDYKDNVASSLPYGLQRKLEIVRALATSPSLILLDEPAAGMNPKETNDLADYIKKIREDHDLTILIIEHHMNFVMTISDRIYVLDFGKTIAYGPPQSIQNNQLVINAYLGEEGNHLC